MMPRFESFAASVGTPGEPEMLESIYRDMPDLDFSSHLLQQIPARLGVVEMSALIWSDWGRPERIAETLERLGQTPAFPVEALAAA
jgi:mannose-1-phosphate guanylyltransferase